MKQSENVQKPQDNGNHYDTVQDGLDLSLHWNKAIDQPKQDPDHDQNHQYLKQRHFTISFSSQAEFRPVQGVAPISVLTQGLLMPAEVGGILRSPVQFWGKGLDVFSPWSACFTHRSTS